MSNSDRRGSIGDLHFGLEQADVRGDFLVVNGDNLFTFALDKVLDTFHRRGNTITLYDVGSETEAAKMGVAQCDATGRVVGFREKPPVPGTTLASIGIYAFRAEVRELVKRYVAERNSPDMTGSFVGWLHQRVPVYAHTIQADEGLWFDIGSHEQYAAANRALAGIPSSQNNAPRPTTADAVTNDSAPRDLLRQPLWRPEDLGQPLPPSVHANSVCLPTWADVIAYEEGDSRVLGQLQTGYPRFFIHPLTERLIQACSRRFVRGDELCHVYPSRASAERCVQSLQRWSGEEGRIESWAEGGPFVVCFSRTADEAARKHWRHSGDGISSRRAETLLEGNPIPDGQAAKRGVRQRIGQLCSVPADGVYLFSSGMSAIYAVHRVISRLWPARMSAQFGFPYVDTLKVQQDLGLGAHFLPRGDEADLGQLRDLVRAEPISAVFCEFPSNPLLVSPDLAALGELARQYGFPLIVDETLGTYVNTDVLRVADVAVTSLTKYFTGVGDVLAGAVILNPHSPLAGRLREAFAGDYEDNLWDGDAVLLADYSADFAERVRRINRTAEQVCEFCRTHPAVAAVYYPKYCAPANYEAFRRPGGGYGGLFSILLRNPDRTSPRFYDSLQLCKGPNLGVNFSLCCPFTLLAHYRELDFVERCGVSRHLIRISVGLEEPQDLIDRLERALRTI
jgi:cystathionine gamma-synthase